MPGRLFAHHRPSSTKFIMCCAPHCPYFPFLYHREVAARFTSSAGRIWCSAASNDMMVRGHKDPWPCFVFVFWNRALFASSRVHTKGLRGKCGLTSNPLTQIYVLLMPLWSIECPLCLYWPVTILTCYSCYLCGIMTGEFQRTVQRDGNGDKIV